MVRDTQMFTNTRTEVGTEKEKEIDIQTLKKTAKRLKRK